MKNNPFVLAPQRKGGERLSFFQSFRDDEAPDDFYLCHHGLGDIIGEFLVTDQDVGMIGFDSLRFMVPSMNVIKDEGLARIISLAHDGSHTGIRDVGCLAVFSYQGCVGWLIESMSK